VEVIVPPVDVYGVVTWDGAGKVPLSCESADVQETGDRKGERRAGKAE
jgi:hypothetical protein